MGYNSIIPGLSLDLKPSFVPKSIDDFLMELNKISSVVERINIIDDYLGRLENEMRKIEAFKREFPLSMLISSDVILVLKEELAKCRKRNGDPILEEFIPLKKNCVEDKNLFEAKIKDDTRDKMNWMSSVQLWNTNDSKTSKTGSGFNEKEQSVPNLTKEIEISHGSCKRIENSREYLSFKEVKGLLAAEPLLLSPSPRTEFSRQSFNYVPNNQANLGVVPHQNSGPKRRRCWSPELHRKFLDALEKLGGYQVATPKQIRDLMQMDGLTNDEVKSHLQKYRLHSRRVPTIKANSSSSWLQKDNCVDSSKQCSTSTSDSPPGPFQFSKISRSIEQENDDFEDEGSNHKLQ